jgi:hypothetical protein
LTSDHKVKANRANAQASTGPKTADGRARAARNALRHALSLPICSNPALSEEVETLAREIAGPSRTKPKCSIFSMEAGPVAPPTAHFTRSHTHQPRAAVHT